MAVEGDFVWDDVASKRLTALLAQGLTRAQIAERFGISKSAVCGRVKRMQDKDTGYTRQEGFWLTHWPQAQRMATEGANGAMIAKALGTTYTAVFRKFRRMGVLLPVAKRSPRRRAAPVHRQRVPVERPKMVAAPIIAIAEPPPPVYLGRIQPCCYVVRSEGRRHWQCDAPSRPRSAYCETHHVACHNRLTAVAPSLPPMVQYSEIKRGRLAAGCGP